MTIETAIEKAIEGGYKNDFLLTMLAMEGSVTHDHIFLDPLFWQSLGKAMRWGIYEKGWKSQGIKEIGEVSLLRWHEFIDYLWAGGKTEDFFSKL